jgi:hypothetical protein
MYVLPADIERLIAHLRVKLDVVLISSTSPGPEPTWTDSPIRQTSFLPSEKGTSVRRCLVANGLANIQFKHYPARSAWHGPLRKGFVTEAILLVLGVDLIEGDGS